MKKYSKTITLILIIIILSCFSLSVNAITIVYSDFTVSAGGYAYSSTSSMTTADRTTCYMRLRWCKFSNYPENTIPSSYYINSRLYRGSLQATSVAHFSQPTSVGNYNYSYIQNNNNFGGANQYYLLKTNSNLDIAYQAKIDWCADPYP